MKRSPCWLKARVLTLGQWSPFSGLRILQVKASSDSPETVMAVVAAASALNHLNKGIKKGYILTGLCKHDGYSCAFSRVYI